MCVKFGVKLSFHVLSFLVKISNIFPPVEEEAVHGVDDSVGGGLVTSAK